MGHGKVSDGLKEPLLRYSHKSTGFYTKRRKELLDPESFFAPRREPRQTALDSPSWPSPHASLRLDLKSFFPGYTRWLGNPLAWLTNAHHLSWAPLFTRVRAGAGPLKTRGYFIAQSFTGGNMTDVCIPPLLTDTNPPRDTSMFT